MSSKSSHALEKYRISERDVIFLEAFHSDGKLVGDRGTHESPLNEFRYGVLELLPDRLPRGFHQRPFIFGFCREDQLCAWKIRADEFFDPGAILNDAELKKIPNGLCYISFLEDLWEQVEGIEPQCKSLSSSYVTWSKCRFPFHVEFKYQFFRTNSYSSWYISIEDCDVDNLEMTATQLETRVFHALNKYKRDIDVTVKALLLDNTELAEGDVGIAEGIARLTLERNKRRKGIELLDNIKKSGVRLSDPQHLPLVKIVVGAVNTGEIFVPEFPEITKPNKLRAKKKKKTKKKSKKEEVTTFSRGQENSYQELLTDNNRLLPLVRRPSMSAKLAAMEAMQRSFMVIVPLDYQTYHISLKTMLKESFPSGIYPNSSGGYNIAAPPVSQTFLPRLGYYTKNKMKKHIWKIVSSINPEGWWGSKLTNNAIEMQGDQVSEDIAPCIKNEPELTCQDATCSCHFVPNAASAIILPTNGTNCLANISQTGEQAKTPGTLGVAILALSRTEDSSAGTAELFPWLLRVILSYRTHCEMISSNNHLNTGVQIKIPSQRDLAISKVYMRLDEVKEANEFNHFLNESLNLMNWSGFNQGCFLALKSDLMVNEQAMKGATKDMERYVRGTLDWHYHEEALRCLNIATAMWHSRSEPCLDWFRNVLTPEKSTANDVLASTSGKSTKTTSTRCNIEENMEAYFYQPWCQHIYWIYYDAETPDSKKDAVTKYPGYVPYPRPLTWYPVNGCPNLRAERNIDEGCVWIMKDKSDLPEELHPKVQYDPENQRLLVWPHRVSFFDVRSQSTHPDYLPPLKLRRYQAVEVCGIRVWRHDRNFLYCALDSCAKALIDHEFSTYICDGCGPMSSIRYCSKEHLLEDMKGHWWECGDDSTCLPCYVDGDTAPERFKNRFPAIREINGWKSAAHHRQKTYTAIVNKGQYTLFPPDSPPLPVTWLSEKAAAKFAPRVERLLNAVLRDRLFLPALSYLFTLLRQALRLSGAHRFSLKLLICQFEEEFGWKADVCEHEACECAWLMKSINDRRGDAIAIDNVHRFEGRCPYMYSQFRVKPQNFSTELEEELEKREGREWILRAWRRIGTQKNWKERLRGYGFPEVPSYHRVARPILGRGWMGLGAVTGPFGGWEEDY